MSNQPPVINTRIRFLYGIGAAAYGVKDNGFNYLLLLYYNQVLGLPATMAGLAIMIALMFDAISDPLVGYWSDNTRSRWGRRHPFMYASALPVSICYYFLWSPPESITDNDALFIYLTILAILIRFLITLYEIPSTALVAELTTDYDERTKLLSMRYLFGWYGGLTMAALAWGVFLASSDDYPNGFLNRAGWENYGLVASGVMFVSIMSSSLGMHRFIPMLPQAPEVAEKKNIFAILGQLKFTLSNRNFLALFAGTLFASAGGGISSSFNSYINLHFWRFSTAQIALIPVALFIAPVIAAVLAPRIGARFDKRNATLGIYALSIVWGVLPIALRLMGLFFDNDHPALLPVMIVHTVSEIVLIIMFGILNSSMLADVVEHSYVTTGRREEGLFFASRTFAAKVAGSVGVFTAGVALDLIQFPIGAAPGEVPDEVIFNMGLIFGPMLVIFYALALWRLSYYNITRSGHDERIAAAKRDAT